MADYRASARAFAIKYGIDPDNFVRQIGAESGFNPRAVSPAGARGIAQIMPATARGWGVNPDDPKASLDAAAKNMGRYLKAYGGSWRKALQAYNAGPGNVGKPLYAETRNYINKILGGKSDERNRAPKRTPGVPYRQPTASAAQQGPPKPDVLGQILSRSFKGSLLDRLGLLEEPEAPPVQQPEQPPSPGRPTSPRSGPATGRHPSGELKELIYTPLGWSVKDGAKVAPYAQAAHYSHVHVASGPKRTVQLGKLAQGMGLSVRENPAFDPVDPVHVEGSYHYRNQAIDVSGDPRKMAAYARKVRAMFA